MKDEQVRLILEVKRKYRLMSTSSKYTIEDIEKYIGKDVAENYAISEKYYLYNSEINNRCIECYNFCHKVDFDLRQIKYKQRRYWMISSDPIVGIADSFDTVKEVIGNINDLTAAYSVHEWGERDKNYFKYYDSKEDKLYTEKEFENEYGKVNETNYDFWGFIKKYMGDK